MPSLGVVVLRASMLDWGDRSASTSTKFGVAVLKASMIDWGVDLPVHLQSLVKQYSRACMLYWWGIDLGSLV